MVLKRNTSSKSLQRLQPRTPLPQCRRSASSPVFCIYGEEFQRHVILLRVFPEIMLKIHPPTGPLIQWSDLINSLEKSREEGFCLLPKKQGEIKTVASGQGECTLYTASFIKSAWSRVLCPLMPQLPERVSGKEESRTVQCSPQWLGWQIIRAGERPETENAVCSSTWSSYS